MCPLFISHSTPDKETKLQLLCEEWGIDQDWSLFVPLPSAEWNDAVSSFDWSSVRGFDAPPEPAPGENLQPIWGAIEELKASNLSRLTRIVRDWTDEGETPPAILIESPVSTTFAHESLHVHLAAPEHRLLKREAQKDLWAWFLHWRDLALEVLDPSVSGNQVLSLLKSARAAIRRRSKSPAPRQCHAPAERLLHLAESIVPHAPPRPLSTESMALEAG